MTTHYSIVANKNIKYKEKHLSFSVYIMLFGEDKVYQTSRVARN